MDNYPRELPHAAGSVMTLDPTRVLIALREPRERGHVERALAGLGLALVPDAEGAAGRKGDGYRINHTDRRYWVQTPGRGGVDQATLDGLGKALKTEVEWVGPVYRVAGESDLDGAVCPLPNAVVIRSTPGAAAEPLAAAAEEAGLREVHERSRYLPGFRYFTVDDPRGRPAPVARRELLSRGDGLIQDVRFEHMPLVVPTAAVPGDPLYGSQWSMPRIGAEAGWDLTTGAAATVVCVLDEGCDLTHPDLQARYSEPGINLGTMAPDGSPTGNHGTPCAGHVAATFDNAEGVTGVAGACGIMPLAFDAWSDVEVATGITYATVNGAGVISMSFGWNGWDPAIIDPAIANAATNDVVMCVATHNHDGAVTYPATNPQVMACGASDQADNRKSPTSPDGELWGSNFGPSVSVVAPGVLNPSTDRQGPDGYNTAGGAAGNYVMDFNGTSSATPHVAGLAGLVRSLYPGLTAFQVRAVIERAAEKVGVVPFADDAAHTHGTWNQEMGYGRINAFRALDLADVYIRDYPADAGVEPSTPPGGDFWDFSDIVVRITDDDHFNPADPLQSSNVERGQENYLYVRVTNNGPREARNVVVEARITPYVGLEFVYPTDWTTVDATHVAPAPIANTFAAIPAGGSAIAKFAIAAAQVESLWGWTTSHPWHPCLLARVDADNDYAFDGVSLAGGGLVVRRNNFAQRNLSVIDVFAGATAVFPFVAGNVRDLEHAFQIVVDRHLVRQEVKVHLTLDGLLDDGGQVFPLLDLIRRHDGVGPDMDGNGQGLDGFGNGFGRLDGHGRLDGLDGLERDGINFVDPTRVELTVGGQRGLLTLERGSRLAFAPTRVAAPARAQFGDIVLRNGQRLVPILERPDVVQLERQPGQMTPLALNVEIPADAQSGERFQMSVSQRRDDGTVVGGATCVFVVR